MYFFENAFSVLPTNLKFLLISQTIIIRSQTIAATSKWTSDMLSRATLTGTHVPVNPIIPGESAGER